MELLAGDRQTPNSSDFPHQLYPFPEKEGFLLYNQSAAAYSSKLDCQKLTPQKLRPIRASGRSPSNSQANDLTPFGGFHGPLDKLGLLVDQVCGINGDTGEFFTPPVKAEVSDGAVNGFGDSGLLSLIADCSVRIGSGTSEENEFPNCVRGLFEDESGSSSGDDSSGIEKNVSRKRKRKSRKKLEDFLQRLVMKVMNKQEEMHKQLVETMERRVRERIKREEAWKEQERERMKREAEVRAQDNARNLALISFIQNVMGDKLKTSQFLVTIPPVEHNRENDSGNLSIQKDSSSDSSNKRWPDSEVQALIMQRAALGTKCSNIWEEISTGMASMGYNRTAKKCKEKWENINKYFRRSLGNGGKKRFENSKSCSYFHELHILYKNGFINPANMADHTEIENEGKNSSA